MPLHPYHSWQTPRTCARPSCRNPFIPKRQNQKFCCKKCTQYDWLERLPRVNLRDPDVRAYLVDAIRSGAPETEEVVAAVASVLGKRGRNKQLKVRGRNQAA